MISLAERQSGLIEANVTWLRQALALLDELADKTYTASPRELEPHRAGSHLRHIIEFYECFLDGLEFAHIDYDARKRDVSIERSPEVAAAKIRSIINRLETDPLLRGDAIVWVRMEASGSFLTSSIGRELQVLSSHTIHHFALIAVTLRALGIGVDPNFGMAPSTLRYLADKVEAA